MIIGSLEQPSELLDAIIERTRSAESLASVRDAELRRDLKIILGALERLRKQLTELTRDTERQIEIPEPLGSCIHEFPSPSIALMLRELANDLEQDLREHTYGSWSRIGHSCSAALAREAARRLEGYYGR